MLIPWRVTVLPLKMGGRAPEESSCIVSLCHQVSVLLVSGMLFPCCCFLQDWVTALGEDDLQLHDDQVEGLFFVGVFMYNTPLLFPGLRTQSPSSKSRGSKKGVGFLKYWLILPM